MKYSQTAPAGAPRKVSTKVAATHTMTRGDKTNSKEIMAAASAQHIQQNKQIQKIKDDLVARVGVLEKWRHVLIGGSIVIGFILHKFINFST